MNFTDLIKNMREKGKGEARVANIGVAAVVEEKLQGVDTTEEYFEFLRGFTWGLRTNLTITAKEQEELWRELMELTYGEKEEEDAE